MSSVRTTMAWEAGPKLSSRRLGSIPAAVADQALISAANLISMVLLARGLSQAAFGRFTLLYSALMLMSSLQSTLITQPHNVLGAARHGGDYARYTTTTAIIQVFVLMVAAMLILAVAGFAHVIRWEAAPYIFALAPSIVAWQSQEFIRRVLYTEQRLGAAFANDMISYGGQTVVIAALWHWDVLTARGALYALAATSAMAAGFGVWQLRGSLIPGFDRDVLRENWGFGKWLAGGELLRWFSSSEMYQYLAAAILGTPATGMLKSAQVIFGPVRVISNGLQSVLPVRFARTLADGGRAALDAQLKLAYLWLAPLFGTYCLLVAVFAGPLLRLLYGAKYTGGVRVLMLYAASSFLGNQLQIVSAALRANRLTRCIFSVYVCTSLVAVSIGWLLIKSFAAEGALIGMILTASIAHILLWHAYRRGPAIGALPEIVSRPERGGYPLKSENGEMPVLLESTHPALKAGGPGAVLLRVFETLDRAGVPYCVLDGYEGRPAGAPPGDVDCVMPASELPTRRAALRDAGRDRIGAQVVQWQSYTSTLITLKLEDSHGGLQFLHLDVHCGYQRDGRRFYTAEEVLESRRRHGQLWVPATDIEFGVYLVKKIAKTSLNEDHGRRLSELYRRDPAGCGRQVARFWGQSSTERIVAAAASGGWGHVMRDVPSLRDELRRSSASRRPFGMAGQYLRRAVRRIGRWFRPPGGVHVVLLGPDGAGKTTVIEGVRRDLAVIFKGRIHDRTTAPALIHWKGFQPGRPHAKRPHSFLGSVAQAIYWLLYYGIGYHWTTYPSLRQNDLVLGHRHLVDSLVDSRRYRYAGPAWLLRLVWWAIPKPDLVIMLDAPAEVVRARKQELPLGELERLRVSYRSLAGTLTNAHVVDAARPIDEVVAGVDEIILNFMATRTAKRLGLGREA